MVSLLHDRHLCNRSLTCDALVICLYLRSMAGSCSVALERNVDRLAKRNFNPLPSCLFLSPEKFLGYLIDTLALGSPADLGHDLTHHLAEILDSFGSNFIN